jgi:hypothetical protein
MLVLEFRPCSQPLSTPQNGMNRLCLIIGDNIQFEVPPANLPQLKESIKLILRKKPSKIYCTHGGPFNPKAVLRKFS